MGKKTKVHHPYNKFKGFLCERGLTYRDIGNLIGITPSTVSLKINGESDFYLSEQRIIMEAYNVGSDIFC